MRKEIEVYLTIKEVQALLKVSHGTFYNHRKGPGFPKPYYPMGKRPKYLQSEIEKYAADEQRKLQEAATPGEGAALVVLRSAVPADSSKVAEKVADSRKAVEIHTKVNQVECGPSQQTVEKMPGATDPDRAATLLALSQKLHAMLGTSPPGKQAPSTEDVRLIRALILSNVRLGKPTFLDEVVEAIRTQNGGFEDAQYVQDVLLRLSRSSADVDEPLLGLMVFRSRDAYEPLPSQLDLALAFQVKVSRGSEYIEYLKKIVERYERQRLLGGEFEFLTPDSPQTFHRDLPRFVRKSSY